MGTAYKNGGHLMADRVAAAIPVDSDLVFPMLYCYRHFLELRVKEMVQCHEGREGQLLEQRDFGHDIAGKHQTLSKNYNEDQALSVYGSPIIEDADWALVFANSDWELVETWVKKFSHVDGNSTRFRYPNGRNGVEHPFPNLMECLGVQDARQLKGEMDALDSATLMVLDLLTEVAREVSGGSQCA